MTQRLHSLCVESVDLEGQGLAHADGKVVFIEGALLGEVVDVEITRVKKNYLKGQAVAWHRESHQRVTPACEFFGVCGGCAMQHVEPTAQLAIKQRSLEDALWHLAKIKPNQILSPLDSPAWGYRTRARLTARYVEKKGGMLLGFHERKSSFVAVMDSCLTLHPRVSEMLPAMRDLIGSLTIAKRLPQVEVAVGQGLPATNNENDSDNHGITANTNTNTNATAQAVVVWVLRILEPPTPADEEKLRTFADHWGVQLWLQPGGPATARPFYPLQFAPLAYRLPEFNLTMPFSPVDFTQVNPQMNQVMVKRAVDLLAPQANDRVADFFCGLGNFTLALARRAQAVLGVEGSDSLLDRAQANAQHHGLENRVQFCCENLFQIDLAWLISLGRLDRILLDPPREGAQALCLALAAMPKNAPKRIVYVSCNPSTLARDASILVHQGGWKLSQAGIINMFPHTTHVESIAVFDRDTS